MTWNMCLMTSQNKFGDQITCMKSSAFSRSFKSECMLRENNKILASRARFRSSDLWVMGPARFRCATLLSCLFVATKSSIRACRLFSCCCYYRSSFLALAFVVLITTITCIYYQ